ncbi:xanthine dehydrogenase family protein molybdopterin-binding subunit [Desulfotalea psychrophila]|uniref:Related to aerobic-type carbon monoxide dehydrogenase, large subunit n=1 Tax=Desulfotalea psychrophila (strain LSv54 / DSM 12343) TaxID=177439 RepID=Q6AK66_DESPS|nr:molybdopterin cofactor-binding domain-containing protein [Desulfotalea psychrophila]CAG37260.1 related to aerobic-type carbon monoxide dehydrogenase, large subunit [Desulfotalea psychrophila LSv54]
MSKFKVVGQNIKRRDGVDKTTGRGLFTSDMSLPGMLHAKVLRSPHPHAKIVSIDVSAAEKMIGVRAIMTHENGPKNLFNAAAPMFLTAPHLERVLDQYLFDDIVRYVGDEVAAVAATTEAIAEQAIKLIRVEYEILPAVLDLEEAMGPDAPELHGDKGCTPEGKNIPGEIIRIPYGDIEKGLAESEVIIEKSFKLPIVKQVQMETQSAVAQVDGNGEVTVWSTTQTPHPTKAILGKIFAMPASKIRVLAPPYVGGGFGVRIGLSGLAEPIAMALAMLAKKPVKLVYSRKEDFIASDTRHPAVVTVKLGADRDGTFRALDVKALFGTGAYCSFGAELPGVCGAMTLAIYRIPHQRYYGHSVYTNQTIGGAMRGFGNPQGNLALEQVVDLMAIELGMDAYELRMKNITQVGDKWCLPFPCLSSELAECMRQGAESIGWKRRGSLNSPGSKKVRGLGMAVGTHVSNAWPFCVDYDNAYVTIQSDGTANVASGVPELGTGVCTSLVQIAAETLSMDVDKISLTYGDTQSTPFDIGSHASRTCYAAGLAIQIAATDAKKQMLEYAAPLFSVTPEDLQIKDDRVELVDATVASEHCSLDDIAGGKGNSVTLEELVYHAHVRNKQFIGVARNVPANAAPWHACFAEVEVDKETGQVEVIKLAAAHDVGTAINPMIVEGQIEGGAVQGIGYALTEEIRYNNRGGQVNSSMHNYMLPTAEDIPPIDAIIVEASDPTGPFGAKGAGECSLVCPASAIANAVADATGIRFVELPITPERVFAALHLEN